MVLTEPSAVLSVPYRAFLNFKILLKIMLYFCLTKPLVQWEAILKFFKEK